MWLFWICNVLEYLFIWICLVLEFGVCAYLVILDLFGFGIWSMWICLVLKFRICLD